MSALNIFVSLQDITTVGTGSDGENVGYYLALSGDANIMAVGAHGASNVEYRAGITKLYRRAGTNWNKFQELTGSHERHANFGFSVDLSDDGSTLVIGARYKSVYIYDYNTGTNKYGLTQTIPADVNSAEVCVSGDGSTIGFTAYSSTVGSKVYKRINNVFQQRGETFFSYGSSSSGIALNYNGTIVAIGDRTWASNQGRVGVFQWRDDDGDGSMVWEQMGSNITGVASDDSLGGLKTVSITHDGLTVSVGAYGYDLDGLSNRGLVRVYNHDSSQDTWQQSGDDIVGDNTKDSLGVNKLSPDGRYLVVGAGGVGLEFGNYVKLLAKKGNNYVMIGDKWTTNEESYFGNGGVDITADAGAIAIGDSGYNNGKGRAYFVVRHDFANILSNL